MSLLQVLIFAVKVILLDTLPDELFHNFRASRSGDRRILCSSGRSFDGF